MAWILLYTLLVLLFFVAASIAKMFGTRILPNNRYLNIAKFIFSFPILFFWGKYVMIDSFPIITKLSAKPDHYQSVQLINKSKHIQSYFLLYKPFLKNHWKTIYPLNTDVNYSRIIEVPPKTDIKLLLPVDTNQFNRISIHSIGKKNVFPYYSMIIDVPTLPVALINDDFVANTKHKFILKNQIEDWIRLSMNFTMLFGFIFLMFHTKYTNKIRYLWLLPNLIFATGFGLLTYYDILFLLKIYLIL